MCSDVKGISMSDKIGDFTSFKRNGLLVCLFLVYLFLFVSACEQDEDPASGSAAGVQPIHTFEFEGTGFDLDASGSYLALAAENQGITVLDTTNPERPQTIANFALPLVYKTILVGKSVFGFDSQQGLVAADLTSQNQFDLKTSLSSVELFGFVNDAVWVDSTFIFASEAIGLSRYTVGKEFNMVGGRASFSNQSAQGETKLEILPEILLASSYHGDISVYNRVEGETPTLSSWIPTSHRISDLSCGNTAAASYCYAAGLEKGLFTYHLTKDRQPELVGETTFKRAVELVHVDEQLMYVSFLGPRGKHGWYVYDLSDPPHPTHIRTIPSASIVKDFARVENMIYILQEDGQIQIFERESLL